MSLHRRIAGEEPAGPSLIEQRLARAGHLATGTLACPGCDAPVALADGSFAPSDALACPFCGRDGAVRDFLSLEPPSRPARVTVRVVLPGAVPDPQ